MSTHTPPKENSIVSALSRALGRESGGGQLNNGDVGAFIEDGKFVVHEAGQLDAWVSAERTMEVEE